MAVRRFEGIVRWHETAKNPNSPEAIRRRTNALASARVGTLVVDRVKYISEVVRGRRVLDVGIVDHFAEASDRGDWLHGHVCRSASNCVGVDVLEAEVEKLARRGFNVICADITREPLRDKFEVIVCGDIIEHVDLPGRLFAHMKQMLAPGGRVVLSTPNPWYINAIWKNMVGRIPFSDSVDHVAWYDPATLCELGERYGLSLERFMGIAVHASSSLLGRALFRCAPCLVRVGVRSEIFAKTLLYEFVVKGDT